MPEAVLLVGGKGTRLRPLTVNTPKPMLPTAGVPFLFHVLGRAAAAGIDHVVLATSYHAEVFREGIGEGEVQFGAHRLRIDYVTEDEPLGTGGGIRNVADLLESGPDDPVVILNGDVLSGHDLAAQIAAHVASRADATLHLTEVDDPRAFGCVPTNSAGHVTAFLEKTPDPVTNCINAGCYVFRRSVIDAIPSGRVVSVEREVFPELVADGSIVIGHLDPAYWLDLGTPAAYVQGSRDLVRGLAPSPVLPGPVGEWLALDGSDVAADAVLSGGTTVGAGVTVGAGATVVGSVLLDGATIGPGAVVRASVVGAGASVGADTRLDQVVIGDGALVGDGNELRSGARVWCDVTIPPYAIRFSPDVPNA